MADQSSIRRGVATAPIKATMRVGRANRNAAFLRCVWRRCGAALRNESAFFEKLL
jgi:hypothetical protein